MKKTEDKSFIKNSPQDNLRSLAIILSAVICAASGLLSYQIEGTFYPLVIQNMMCLLFAGIFLILSMWVNDEKEAYKHQFFNAFFLTISSIFFLSNKLLYL